MARIVDLNGNVLLEIGGSLSFATLRYVNLPYAMLEYQDIQEAVLVGANLCFAKLKGADLTSTNLRGADLCCADLRNAKLQNANLRGAKLRDAKLQGAKLCGAILWGADLQVADLRGADLRRTDLRNTNLLHANLRDADLRGTDLRNAKLARAKIEGARKNYLTIGLQPAPEGELIGWGKKNGKIVKLLIPGEAYRSCATTRKFRAEFALCLWTETEETVIVENSYGKAKYTPGEWVFPHDWDPDRWNECSAGIHFFLTREEAEAWTG